MLTKFVDFKERITYINYISFKKEYLNSNNVPFKIFISWSKNYLNNKPLHS